VTWLLRSTKNSGENNVALTEVIYKRDSAGKLRTWQAEVEGDKYRTIAGLVGGSLVTSAWTTCIGKQKRNNEEQAQFEANSELNKKLDREYRRTEAELDSVPLSVMLAQDYAKQKGDLFIDGSAFSQPKLDGIRALISQHGAFSREYQRHLNVDHILEDLAPVFAKYPELQLDGELYNHDLKEDFNKIASVVRKQTPDDAQRDEARRLIQYHVYDLPSRGASSFGLRLAEMELLFSEFALVAVKKVPTVRCKVQSELDDLNGQYIQQGYEGQMVRLNAPYEFDKRSKYLLKRKEFITEEFPIKRIEEGQGNWAGYAKRVVLDIPEAPDGEVGAGMRGSQDFAKKLLENAINYKQATVRHFGRTPDQSLRFPVAIDFHLEGRRD
jgi:DNA ligase-1